MSCGSPWTGAGRSLFFAGTCRVTGDGGEIERLFAVQAALAARQGEQRLEELLLLPPAVDDVFAGRAKFVESEAWIGERDLEHGPLHGERRPQLVRGVGDEVALRLEGGLQPLEQAVDDVCEVFQLVTRTRKGKPPVQALLGDVPRRARDRGDRPQDPPCHQPAEQHRDDCHGAKGDARSYEQRVQVRGALRRGQLAFCRCQPACGYFEVMQGQARCAADQVAARSARLDDRPDGVVD
jgi:hypothetical protein